MARHAHRAHRGRRQPDGDDRLNLVAEAALRSLFSPLAEQDRRAPGRVPVELPSEAFELALG
jgi:hypothetical protein